MNVPFYMRYFLSLSLSFSVPLSLSQVKIFLVRSPLFNLKRTLSIKMFSSLCLSLSLLLSLSLSLSSSLDGTLERFSRSSNVKRSTLKARLSKRRFPSKLSTYLLEPEVNVRIRPYLLWYRWYLPVYLPTVEQFTYRLNWDQTVLDLSSVATEFRYKYLWRNHFFLNHKTIQDKLFWKCESIIRTVKNLFELISKTFCHCWTLICA